MQSPSIHAAPLKCRPFCQPTLLRRSVVPTSGSVALRRCLMQAQKAIQSRENSRAGEQSDRLASCAKGSGVAALISLLSPLPSLAEQHNGVFAIADVDAQTAGKIASVLGPVLSLAIFLMICRIPMSWYPNLNRKKFPWVVAIAPTEPVLGPTRKAIPPVGGVDIAPIIWVALLSFFNEILLGPQGILNLLQRKADL